MMEAMGHRREEKTALEIVGWQRYMADILKTMQRNNCQPLWSYRFRTSTRGFTYPWYDTNIWPFLSASSTNDTLLLLVHWVDVGLRGFQQKLGWVLQDFKCFGREGRLRIFKLSYAHLSSFKLSFDSSDKLNKTCRLEHRANGTINAIFFYL